MGSATARSKPATDGVELNDRLAALVGRMEAILAQPSALCEAAAIAVTDLSRQAADLRVAHEDALIDAEAISAAFAAGIDVGERRAVARQQLSRQRKSSRPCQPPIMKLVAGGLAAAGEIAGA